MNKHPVSSYKEFYFFLRMCFSKIFYFSYHCLLVFSKRLSLELEYLRTETNKQNSSLSLSISRQLTYWREKRLVHLASIQTSKTCFSAASSPSHRRTPAMVFQTSTWTRLVKRSKVPKMPIVSVCARKFCLGKYPPRKTNKNTSKTKMTCISEPCKKTKFRVKALRLC